MRIYLIRPSQAPRALFKGRGAGAAARLSNRHSLLVTSFRVMSCHVMLRYVIRCHVISCHVMSCGAVPCCVDRVTVRMDSFTRKKKLFSFRTNDSFLRPPANERSRCIHVSNLPFTVRAVLYCTCTAVFHFCFIRYSFRDLINILNTKCILIHQRGERED